MKTGYHFFAKEVFCCNQVCKPGSVLTAIYLVP